MKKTARGRLGKKAIGNSPYTHRARWRCRVFHGEWLEERRLLTVVVESLGSGIILHASSAALPFLGPAVRVQASATGTFNIELEKSPALLANAAASAAFDKAAEFYESIFFDPVTVIIDADFAPLGPGIIGQTSSSDVTGTYDELRTLLVADAAADEAVATQIPTLAQFQFIVPVDPTNPFSLSGATANRATLKALGVPESSLPGPQSQFNPSVVADMTMQFSSDFPFDFDPSNGIDSNKIDFVGVAIHEIGHGLGFVSSVDTVDFLLDNSQFSRVVSPAPLDLFRLRPGAGSFDFTTSPRVFTPEGNAVFYDGGIYNPVGFSIPGLTSGDIPLSTGRSNGDGQQASHWKSDDVTGVTIGTMDPTADFGQLLVFSPQDQRAFGLIGYDLTPLVVPSKLTIDDVSRVEGDSGTTDLVFTVTAVAGINTGTVTVEYATVNGNAVAPGDYIASSGTLTFDPDGPQTQTITIQVVGDTLAEPDETFLVNLSNPTNAVLSRTQATGTIKNDDVDVSINDVTITEGDAGTKNAVFTITALGSTDRTVAVSYTTLNGTAIAGSDFLPAGGAVTFAPGGGTATVTVPIIGDKLNESTETFTVQLLSPQGSRLSKGVGVGTILDNDLVPGLYVNDVFLTTTSPDVLAAVFTVALGAPSGQLVTVEFATADGTALSGIDYISQADVLTFAPGTTTQLVTVPVITSGVYSPNEKFALNLSNSFHAQLGDPLGIATVIFADPPIDERIIDDGDPGYSKTAGWVNLTNTLAYQLDYDYHAAGTGANFATWAFGSLPNGEYEVFAKWIAFGNRASNAPYTILDGLAPRGTVTIDQRIAPSGDQSNGITWQSLGLFSISNGSLAVRLGDNANGLVVADAIRIVADGIPPAEPEMDVAGSDRSIGTFDLSPAVDDGTDFGAVASNSNSVTHTFAITNTGNADLHLTGAPRVAVAGAHAADFTVLVQPGSSIAPGFQSTFQIIFHPSDSGLRQAVISIANDDDSEHPYTYAVQGTGVATGPAELTVDDVTSGFTAIGAWPANTNSLAFAGQHRSAPAGPGNSNTSWEFHGLAPGQYEVLTTWTPFNNRATNASYIIADGNVAETAVGVNQRQSPNDAFADGVMWESLALFQVTTGELTVRLNNNANGYIVADAVRIIRQGAAIAAVAPVVAHNSQLSLDVNGDTRITSSDALLVVSRLLSPQPAVSPLAALASPLATADGADSTYYLDVNGDGRVTARDALIVIGYLLNPSAQTASATPVASLATGQPSATTLAAVDQAIGQLDEPELEPAVSPLTTKASTPATDVAQQPASKTTQLLTPQSVRAYFASSAKKSPAKDSQPAML